MNHCVPDFDIEMDDDEYPIPSSGLPRAKKSSMPDDEIMELLWQNGQVVIQSQNQRSPTKPTPTSYAAEAIIPAGPSTVREVRSSQHSEVENLNYQNQQLFMQEDEMTSWLHYPIVDDTPLDHNFCADLLYPPPTANNNNNTHTSAQNFGRTSQVDEFRKPSRSVGAPRPPIPPARRTDPVQTKIQNFAHFSKHNARVEPAPSSSKNVMKESTVMDSSDTPEPAVSRISETIRNSTEPTDIETGRGNMSSAGVAAPSATSCGGGTGDREVMTCEMTVTSSPGGSSASAEPAHRTQAEDRKRKGREPDNSECRSEDVDFESADVRKQARGSTSNKRSRAAEVHNLSERRRRDRINEKMKALQELIPRCNKSDKASMLDEAIEYLKSLQLQVQMMSMGCGMIPMMFPGLQQYMAATPMGMGIGMGVGMGMGMGMEMGMNRPVMPFPNMLGGSALPASTAHLGPRFPVAPFRMPPNAPRAPDSSRMQPANQADPPMLNSSVAPGPSQLRIPNFGDPYQQYLGPHQMQFQLMQNQAINQPNVNQPSSSKDNEELDNHKSEGT